MLSRFDAGFLPRDRRRASRLLQRNPSILVPPFFPVPRSVPSGGGEAWINRILGGKGVANEQNKGRMSGLYRIGESEKLTGKAGEIGLVAFGWPAFFILGMIQTLEETLVEYQFHRDLISTFLQFGNISDLGTANKRFNI